MKIKSYVFSFYLLNNKLIMKFIIISFYEFVNQDNDFNSLYDK